MKKCEHLDVERSDTEDYQLSIIISIGIGAVG
jgi:hypothetical protein